MRFRVAPGHEVEVVSFLRHVGLHAAYETPGIAEAFAGSRLAHSGREHVSVSIWGSPDSATRGTAPSGVPRFLSSVAGLIEEREASRYDSIADDQDPGAPAKVLRIARWATGMDGPGAAPRERAIWRPQGCVGAWLAVSEASVDDRIAVSAWRSWEPLTAAAGGRVAAPLRMLGEDDVSSAWVRHYELLSSGST